MALRKNWSRDITSLTSPDREALRRAIAENGGDLIIQTSMTGYITYISGSVEHLTGFKRDFFIGRSIVDLLGVDTTSRLSAAVRARMENPQNRAEGVEYCFKHADGREIWVEARPSPLLDSTSGEQVGVTDIVRDITASRETRKKLEFVAALLEVQLEASPSAILVVDAQSRIAFHNTKFTAMWNISPSDLAQGNTESILAAVAALVADEAELSGRVDFLIARPDVASHREILRKDGRWIETHTVPMHSAEKTYLGRAFFFQDVTAQKGLLESAIRRARFDGLTGLANRDVFVDAAENAIGMAKRGASGFAVMFLDLDRFKPVNDTFGHAVGDELLKQVAVRLTENLRAVDLVARFGGDEFAILVSGTDEPAALRLVATKILRALAAPFHIQNQCIRSGASIGIQIYGDEAPDVATLLLHADTALYRAKAKGRASCELF